jgi:hypothetical protein
VIVSVTYLWLGGHSTVGPVIEMVSPSLSPLLQVCVCVVLEFFVLAFEPALATPTHTAAGNSSPANTVRMRLI